MGRGHCSGARAPCRNRPSLLFIQSSGWPNFPGTFKQCWNSLCHEQGTLSQLGDKPDSQTRVPAAGPTPDSSKDDSCHESNQHFRCTLIGCNRGVPIQLSFNKFPDINSITRSSSGQISITVSPVLTPPVSLPSPHLHPPPVGTLQLNESPFWLNCHVKECIFLWRGINTAPASTINDPMIHLIAALVSRASL